MHLPRYRSSDKFANALAGTMERTAFANEGEPRQARDRTGNRAGRFIGTGYVPQSR